MPEVTKYCKMSKPNILLWDLETSLMAVRVFDLKVYSGYIPPNSIQATRFIHCASYKWFGQKKIHAVSALDNKRRFKVNHHDDFHVVSHMRKVLSKADAIVAHNGSRFDEPFLNDRMAYHGIDPLPKIISLDTLKICKRYFKFPSNKLDFVARHLGYRGKMVNPTNLWDKCYEGDEKALSRLIKYNKRDVDILEFVFKKLMPYVKNNPLNANLFLGGLTCTNPTCGSTNLIRRGFNYTRVNKYQRFLCKDCGSWCDERTAHKPSRPVVK